MADETLPAGPMPKELAVDYVRRVTASLGVPVTRLPAPSAETQTLGAEGKVVVQRARAWAQALAIVGAALAAAIPLAVSSYHALAEEARVRAKAAAQAAKAETQRVKNESEAGYQVTAPVLEEYDRRLRALEMAQRRAGHPRPTPPRAPRVLPPDLAHALRQVSAAQVPLPPAPPAPAPPPPRGDAAP
jgi:hypothetical protein